MKIYSVNIYGCDDSTHFNMEMTEEQHEFLLKVAKLSTETSRYGCMPTISIENEDVSLYEVDEEEDENIKDAVNISKTVKELSVYERLDVKSSFSNAVTEWDI